MSNESGSLYCILPARPAASIPCCEEIGSKAFGLARLARIGLSVPPAFVLGTAMCRDYFARGGKLPQYARDLLVEGLSALAEATGRRFGDPRRPLLVSVRSGAPVSMPGMMETILNIGLNETTSKGLLRLTGNPRQVRDCYRRLIRDYTEVVGGVDILPFDQLVDRHVIGAGLADASDLDSQALGQIVQESLDTAIALTGQPFPQDPLDQLVGAVEAVFRSWISSKACAYRRLNNIDDGLGTAVTVQAMVFGNAGGNSGAGVGFTRDPATGETRPYLDFLFNAQGEDVVAGRRAVRDTDELPRRLPAVAAELTRITRLLESEFRDMQDFEFTVENGRLYLLQTRDGKRAPWAALRIVVDLVREGLIDRKEGLARIASLPLERIERVRIAAGVGTLPLAKATPASLGVALGAIAFDATAAQRLAAEGRPAILVRENISTADIDGIAAASGVLTATGGRTSHAAVVARQLGKVCLVGCSALRIDLKTKSCVIGEKRLNEGDKLTLDGEAGRVFAGALAVIRETPAQELAEIAKWRAA